MKIKFTSVFVDDQDKALRQPIGKRNRSSTPLYDSDLAIQRSIARASLTDAIYAVSFLPMIFVNSLTSLGNSKVVASRYAIKSGRGEVSTAMFRNSLSQRHCNTS